MPTSDAEVLTMADETLPDFILDEEALAVSEQLFRTRLASGRPFPVSGDVLFVRTAGAFGRANILYQKWRRRELPARLFRFTHVGLVASHGAVIHSLVSAGVLERRVMQSVPASRKRRFRSGVTIDSLGSSGFLGEKALDFCAFRSRKVFGSVTLQEKINQLALYYFGLQYNFAIDHKQRFRSEADEKFRLHCSDLVERVLVALGAKSGSMHAARVLPADVYASLAEDDSWEDVTAQYRSSELDLDDESLAESTLVHHLLLQGFRARQLDAAATLTDATEKLDRMKARIEKDPERYAGELTTFREGSTLEGSLKACYRLLTGRPASIAKIHAYDEILSRSMLGVDEWNLELGRDLFSNHVRIACLWYEQALRAIALAREDGAEQRGIDGAIAEMTALAATLPPAKSNPRRLQMLFARLARAQAGRSPSAGRLALAFHELATTLSLMTTMVPLGADEVTGDLRREFLLRIAATIDMADARDRLLSRAHVVPGPEADEREGRFAIDFAALLPGSQQGPS